VQIGSGEWWWSVRVPFLSVRDVLPSSSPCSWCFAIFSVFAAVCLSQASKLI
ncbi:hypothetical protein A2U01_0116313, partial [Trifolium medium]|nr:hypothetical protein [Trifolium medium]